MRRFAHSFFVAAGLALALSACAMNSRSDLPPSQLKAVEARNFPSADKATVIRAVAETLLETGFVLDRVDPQGKVWASAETFMDSYKVVASITPRGANAMEVRFVTDRRLGANLFEIDNPKFYDDKFFKPLEKNLGLPALPAG